MAVVGGFLLGVMIVSRVQLLGHTIFPPPVTIDPSDPASIEAAMQLMPIAALLFVVAAWTLGCLIGSMTATLIAGPYYILPGMIVGLAILIVTAVNLYHIPHPLWMALAGLLIPLPVAWAGIKLVWKLKGA